jgi:L-ascorbate metabolism protein UlaG (beta-lactamase superfamily)
MKLIWFGHSAFRLDMDGAVVLFDPFLTGNPSFSGDVGAATAGVTHILLTHGHDDHVGDAAEIARRTGAQVVANFEICMWLAGQGAANVNPGNTGGEIDCGPFRVAFTQALHSSGAVKDGASVYLGNPNGLIVKPKVGRSVYHMGDTDLFGDMALIQELHAPKIGLVPIGDRFTMGAKTAALACKRYFDFDVVLPCHYATFDMLDQTADAFVAQMKAQGVRAKVEAPAPGGAREL